LLVKVYLAHKITMLDQPIQISTRAISEIADTFSANKIPESYGLRVGIKGGGCSGSFLLGFDTASEQDQVYQVEGIKVIIDRKHLMYVLGVEVDYEETENGAGFTVMMNKDSGN
jgi:iron-sulfur cluster assembly protein